jgi:hypothetical protein
MMFYPAMQPGTLKQRLSMRGLSEVVPIIDTICSGLAAVERLDGNLLRFWLYVQQTNDEGSQEKIVVSKIVVPATAVPDAVMRMLGALDPEARIVPLVNDILFH